MDTFKILVAGDYGVGKTCLLMTYTNDKPPTPDDHIPVVFEHHSTHNHPMIRTIDGREVALNFQDTVHYKEDDRLRPLAYLDTNVCLLCFSLVNQASLNNAHQLWYPEIKHYCPNIPFLLIGTNVDLRDHNESKNVEVVSHENGLKVAKLINATKYLECSSITQLGLHNVVEEAVRAARKSVKPRSRRIKRCSIC